MNLKKKSTKKQSGLQQDLSSDGQPSMPIKIVGKN